MNELVKRIKENILNDISLSGGEHFFLSLEMKRKIGISFSTRKAEILNFCVFKFLQNTNERCFLNLSPVTSLFRKS